MSPGSTFNNELFLWLLLAAFIGLAFWLVFSSSTDLNR